MSYIKVKRISLRILSLLCALFVLILPLTGCSSAEDDAAEIAQGYFIAGMTGNKNEMKKYAYPGTEKYMASLDVGFFSDGHDLDKSGFYNIKIENIEELSTQECSDQAEYISDQFETMLFFDRAFYIRITSDYYDDHYGDEEVYGTVLVAEIDNDFYPFWVYWR